MGNCYKALQKQIELEKIIENFAKKENLKLEKALSTILLYEKKLLDIIPFIRGKYLSTIQLMLPFTPAIHLVNGNKASLRLIEDMSRVKDIKSCKYSIKDNYYECREGKHYEYEIDSESKNSGERREDDGTIISTITDTTISKLIPIRKKLFVPSYH